MHCSLCENQEERSSPYTLFAEFIFYYYCHIYGNQGNSVNIVTRLHAGRPPIVFWFLAWLRGVSALQKFQTRSGAHPASYAKKTLSPLPRGKVAASSIWPLAAHCADLKNKRSLASCYFMPLWGAPHEKLFLLLLVSALFLKLSYPMRFLTERLHWNCGTWKIETNRPHQYFAVGKFLCKLSILPSIVLWKEPKLKLYVGFRILFYGPN